MKIAMIGGAYNKGDQIKGGVTSVVSTLVSQFKGKEEIELVLLGEGIQYREEDNITFDNISLPWPSIGRVLNYFLFSDSIIDQIEKKYSPDLYHFQGTVPFLLLLDDHINNKSIFTQHGILEEELKYQTTILKKLKFYIKAWVESRYFKKIHNIIFISDYNRKWCLENNDIGRIQDSTLIYNPVDELFFDNETGTNDDLYFLGEIKKRKGLHDLLHVLSELKDQGLEKTLHVIGGFKEQQYKNEINKLVKKLDIKNTVRFHGWKSRQEIVEITSSCSVFVLPSYQETLPVSVAEAMAMGKVVVSSNLPGIREMIDDKETGFLYPKGERENLKKVILNVYQGDVDVQAIKSNATQKASKMFSGKQVADQTLSFYKKIKLN